MMRPPPRARISGTAPRQSRTTLRSKESIALIHARSSIDMKRPDRRTARVGHEHVEAAERAHGFGEHALDVRRARQVRLDRQDVRAGCLISRAARASASPPRAQIATRKPSRARASAEARPSPLLAAHTRATRADNGVFLKAGPGPNCQKRYFLWKYVSV